MTIIKSLALVLLLSGCAVAAHQPLAEDDVAARIRAGHIGNGMAHVYLYLGDIHGGLTTDGDRLTRSTFIVMNDKAVGGIDRGDCLFLNLKPGAYRFYATDRLHLFGIEFGGEDVSPSGHTAFEATLLADHDYVYAVNLVQDTLNTVLNPPRRVIEDRSATGLSQIGDLTIVLRRR